MSGKISTERAQNAPLDRHVNVEPAKCWIVSIGDAGFRGSQIGGRRIGKILHPLGEFYGEILVLREFIPTDCIR